MRFGVLTMVLLKVKAVWVVVLSLAAKFLQLQRTVVPSSCSIPRRNIYFFLECLTLKMMIL
jgi:hypothetical protein